MPAGVTNCDDMAPLVGDRFVGCSNGVLSNGRGGPPHPESDTSTLLEYTTAGKFVNKWSIKNQIAGIGADPLHRRVIVTLDEAANSRLVAVDPRVLGSPPVVRSTYTPNPQSATASKALHTGGGTDSVVIDSNGHIFITGSDPRRTTGTATFKVVLTPPNSATSAGKAALNPTFRDNATAANGNTGRGRVSWRSARSTPTPSFLRAARSTRVTT